MRNFFMDRDAAWPYPSSMNFNLVKAAVEACTEVQGLEAEAFVPLLLYRGTAVSLTRAATVYVEATPLDSTFCILVDGRLEVLRGGAVVGTIEGYRVFGEMAYFTAAKTRTATIRVASATADVLRITMTPDELNQPRMEKLVRRLGIEAWDRFIESSR